MVIIIFPQMIRLNAEEHIYVWQAFGTKISCLFPCPELAAEVSVKADGDSFFFCNTQAVHNQLAAVWGKRRSNAAQVQPCKAVQQSVQVYGIKIKLSTLLARMP